jgi:hydrogenase maturation protease
MTRWSTPLLVLGIGNEFRRDDGAGLEVARRVTAENPDGLIVRETGGDAAAWLDAWEGFNHVVAVDAVSSGAEPGTIFRFEADERPLPRVFASLMSSHGLGLSEAIELARALGRLPAHLTIYGIEGDDFGEGIGLSPGVRRAVEKTAARIISGDADIPVTPAPRTSTIKY